MKHFIFIFISFLLFLPLCLTAQSGYDIRVKLDNYKADSLWFGHTYGKRAIPASGTTRGPDGWFHLQSDKPQPPGLYAIIFKRGSQFQFISCWLAEGQRHFSIETDITRLASSTRCNGSPENTALFGYFSRYYTLRDQLDDLTIDWKSLQDESSYQAMVQAQEELRRFQEDIIQQHPGTLTADLVSQTLFLTPGEFVSTDWKSDAETRHHWMRNHYFDRMDLGSGRFMKYPLWVDRTDYYFSKLPPPVPDSLVVMVEEVFKRLEPDTEAYQYYVGYVMNSLARMSRHRTDEAFVSLVRTYLDKGEWDFLSEDRKDQYRNDANRMEPLFAGKKCPDVTLYDRQGNPVSIYGTEAPYLLLVFWLYDCGHCKKEIPVVKKIYETFRQQGLQVMSVCGKSGTEETPACWNFAETMEMPAEWLLLNDPQRKSRFSTLLNVRSYPRLILLDKNKQILYKQTGEVPEAILFKELSEVVR